LYFPFINFGLALGIESVGPSLLGIAQLREGFIIINT